VFPESRVSPPSHVDQKRFVLSIPCRSYLTSQP
jgi:hypothetical protein